MIYRFEDFELDAGRFELRKRGVPVGLEPQVFQLLVLLVANHSRLVHKEEILDRIWDGRAVSDAAISSRVKSARHAVDDDGRSQRLIRTVHGQGFRFVGTPTAATEPDAAVAPASQNTRRPAGTPPVPSTRPTIAVLPFMNLSGDAGQDYFSDAIAQDVLAALSKHRWLNVIARNTSFSYRGRGMDALVATDLGINYVVEGSVRRSGSRIRVATQLVDAVTGTQAWGERYDRDIEDVFAVQDEIVQRIAAQLEPEIGFAERQRIVRRPPTDLQAWDCFHLGLAHFFKFTAADNLEAQRLLQRSRELDPRFGEGHAWWAYAIVLGMVYWDTDPTAERLDEALAATAAALDTDDRSAVFYALKARVQLARGEYRSARAGNETAIRLNPTLAAAYCGLADTLVFEGEYDKALAHFGRAVDLSPNDPQRWAFFTYGALALIFKGDFEGALQWTERAIEIPNCQYWTTAHRAVALACLNRLAEARAAVAALMALNPAFSVAFARKKLFYLKQPGQLRLYLDGLVKAGVEP